MSGFGNVIITSLFICSLFGFPLFFLIVLFKDVYNGNEQCYGIKQRHNEIFTY